MESKGTDIVTNKLVFRPDAGQGKHEDVSVGRVFLLGEFEELIADFEVVRKPEPGGRPVGVHVLPTRVEYVSWVAVESFEHAEAYLLGYMAGYLDRGMLSNREGTKETVVCGDPACRRERPKWSMDLLISGQYVCSPAHAIRCRLCEDEWTAIVHYSPGEHNHEEVDY